MMQIREASQIDVSVIDLGDDERLIIAGEAAVERFKKSREQILPMARGPTPHICLMETCSRPRLAGHTSFF